MSQQDISCGLEYIITPDLQSCVTDALRSNYCFIVTPIVHPRFHRQYRSVDTIGGFTRSDMILAPNDWTNRIVGRVTPYLNLDVPSPIVRQRYEDLLNAELGYCKGLGIPAVIVPLHGRESTNLARTLLTYFESSHHPSPIWLRVPLVCNRPFKQKEKISEEDDDDESAYEETWLWWSRFHELVEYDKRTGIALEISANLPSKKLLNRWLGEPVKAIILPTSVFHNNKKGYPVLSQAHQKFVADMVEQDAQVIVTGARRNNIEHYLQYLFRLWKRRQHAIDEPMLSYARGWEDYLQTPLQPLADNLDTHTYNVFEKDPIKYDQYQKAIAKALIDVQIKNENAGIEEIVVPATGEDQTENKCVSGVNCSKKTITLMVLGAGRGPLVRAAFNAADLTNAKIKVVAVEKNPCAVVVLEAQAREIWADRDIKVVTGDMRHLKLSPKADIIVSELLGSWGDNELSPECLDGATGLLKEGGISIPNDYTSYAAPITSPRLWAAAKVAGAYSPKDNKDKNFETLWVVYMQNKYNIAEAKPVFKFEHPAKGIKDCEGETMTDYRELPITDNRRMEVVTWKAEQDNIMHGFAGYFDSSLYADEMISIVPSTHSPGMISWFPVYIPIKTPLRVKKGDTIQATFWRCVDSRRVWYEWVVRVGDQTTLIHNTNGRSSEMLL